jgi:hypothetical protein
LYTIIVPCSSIGRGTEKDRNIMQEMLFMFWIEMK